MNRNVWCVIGLVIASIAGLSATDGCGILSKDTALIWKNNTWVVKEHALWWDETLSQGEHLLTVRPSEAQSFMLVYVHVTSSQTQYFQYPDKANVLDISPCIAWLGDPLNLREETLFNVDTRTNRKLARILTSLGNCRQFQDTLDPPP